MTIPLVEGELRADANSSPLRWTVIVERTGSVAVEFEPVELASQTSWLLTMGMIQGKFVPRVSMRGTAPDGIVVESDHIHLLNVNTESDAAGTRLSLSASASKLRLLYRRMPETSRGVHAIYFTVGMRAFGSPSTNCPIGRITLAGPTTLDRPDDVQGRVHIEATGEERPFAEWLSACDREVERVLDMISLAEGGFIRWSVRRIETEEGLTVIDCHGAKGAGPAWDGVFHHLNLQPVLDLAVTRYTEELCERSGLNVALEWFVHHPRYSELQLIAAMTALEHLVASFEQRHGVSGIMAPQLFEKLLQEMQARCDEAQQNASDSGRLRIDRVRQKLAHINEPSFRDKLEAMLATYNVPLAGLELSRISKAVAARNRILHRGLYRSKEGKADLQEHVAVLRELLKRIFLTLLDYEGQYFCLLNGPEWNHFPPSGETGPNVQQF
ncbi:MAG: hypothetical protein ABJF10_28140 [Chthoniobacter sp.]|uniref:hypothetical protein n=1 Tax=Chthoniobacter sp. TaxID=2510640 RepID=UPI0032A3478D